MNCLGDYEIDLRGERQQREAVVAGRVRRRRGVDRSRHLLVASLFARTRTPTPHTANKVTMVENLGVTQVRRQKRKERERGAMGIDGRTTLADGADGLFLASTSLPSPPLPRPPRTYPAPSHLLLLTEPV